MAGFARTRLLIEGLLAPPACCQSLPKHHVVWNCLTSTYQDAIRQRLAGFGIVSIICENVARAACTLWPRGSVAGMECFRASVCWNLETFNIFETSEHLRSISNTLGPFGDDLTSICCFLAHRLLHGTLRYDNVIFVSLCSLFSCFGHQYLSWYNAITSPHR
jgi:hypothetical protein